MLRDECLEKKEELENAIKEAMTKFMNETGLVIDSLQTNTALGRQFYGVVLLPDSYREEQMKALLNNLKIIISL